MFKLRFVNLSMLLMMMMMMTMMSQSVIHSTSECLLQSNLALCGGAKHWGRAILYWMRSGTRSQCRLSRTSVMWSERLNWKISRAPAFNTDCRRRRRQAGMPTSTLLPKSSRDSTNLTTSICRVAVGTDRRIWHSCRRAPKHRDIVRSTCVRRAASMWIPRSRTDFTGATETPENCNAEDGNWCWRRLVAHHITSVLAGFNWSRFELAQLTTSSRHIGNRRRKSADSRRWAWAVHLCIGCKYGCI